MSLLGVRITMPSFVPFTFVENLRQNQSCFNRIQRLALIKHLVIRVRAPAEEIGDYPPSSHLSDNPRSQAIPGSVNGNQLNFWKLLTEFIEQRFSAITANIEVESAFFFCRHERLFPCHLPRWLRFGAISRS